MDYLSAKIAVAWERPLRLIVRMPPRHGKSETCSHWTPVWFLENWPEKRVMLASYEATFAAKWGRDVRDSIVSNQEALSVHIKPDVSATNAWETTAGGGMFTAGVGGPITGRGAHLAILDDPIKNAEEATSDTIRDKMREWYKTTFRTRFEPGASCIIVYTAWTDDDIGAWVEQETGENWETLCLPAIAEGNDVLGRHEGEALWPERFDRPALDATRKSMTPYWFCTPEETPVLMADWTTKPIASLRAGDEIVGFKTGTPDKRAQLISATVKRVFSRQGTVYDLKLESGRKVRCTKDHQWFLGDKRRNGKEYDSPKVGRRLMFIEEPQDACTEEERSLWWYLAGIVDGEGCVKQGGVLVISQSPTSNGPTFERIKTVLDRLNIKYALDVREQKGHADWGKQGNFIIHDVHKVYRKLLRFTDFGKKPDVVARMFRRGHMFIRERDRVLAIRNPKDEPVYALETTTGNYVAWGYGSSNSAMYQQRPAQREGAIFRRDTLRYCQVETTAGRTVYVLPAANSRISRDLCRHFIMYDGARTEATQSDYTVASYFAVTPKNDLLVLDVVRDHLPPDAFEALIRSQNEKHTPGFHGFEPADWNTATVQALVRQGFKGQRVPPEGTRQISKTLRSEAAQIIARNGKLYLLANAPWLPDFEAELLSFPVGAHDDQVDTLSMAGNEVTEGRVTGKQLVVHVGPRRTWGAK